MSLLKENMTGALYYVSWSVYPSNLHKFVEKMSISISISYFVSHQQFIRAAPSRLLLLVAQCVHDMGWDSGLGCNGTHRRRFISTNNNSTR
jgi:hypothetical protein